VIARIEALNYRCLRYVAQDLESFHVLVGPNASGKSTFLDVFALMSDLISLGPDGAVAERVPDFRDLVWMRGRGHFEVAVEVSVPEDRRGTSKNGGYSRARYEVSLVATHSPVILSIASLGQVLCFAKTSEGATDIVRGNDHPGLKHWKGEVDLGTLFASGVLGETPVHAD
jgi:energy-coupling factor transporter ATP-binding protein EcfA2